MQYILLATSLVTVAILIAVIIKLSKQSSNEESLRRIEQELTATSARLDELRKANDRFNSMIDSRLMQFSTGNDKLTIYGSAGSAAGNRPPPDGG